MPGPTEVSSSKAAGAADAALRRLLPTGVPAAVLSGSHQPASLMPGEEDAIRQAVPSRRREFALGRECARMVLAEIGVPAAPIVMDDDRAPRWPEGVVGSITHTKGLAAAVAARRGVLDGIGLDVEGASPLGENLVQSISTPGEAEWLRTRDLDHGLWFKALFCAKEALYKCVYPRERELFGFHAVEVALQPDERRFSAVWRGNSEFESSRLVPAVQGTIGFTPHHILAVAVLP